MMEALPIMGNPQHRDDGDDDIVLEHNLKQDCAYCGKGEGPSEEDVTEIAKAIEESVGEMVTRLHKEEAFLIPISLAIGDILQHVSIRMKAKCRICVCCILINHDVCGSCKQVGMIGKSSMGEEKRTMIAQIGSKTTIGRIPLYPRQVDDLLPYLHEATANASPSV